MTVSNSVLRECRQFQWLAMQFEVRYEKEEEMLIQEGEEITATGLWFISKGECAVTRMEVPGWCRILGPGNHFGVSTILITY